jgi:hypothetical protein
MKTTTSAAVSMQPIDQLAKQAAKELHHGLQPVIAQMIDSMGIPDKLKQAAAACLYSEFMHRLGHAFMDDIVNTTDSIPAPMPTETSRSIH